MHRIIDANRCLSLQPAAVGAASRVKSTRLRRKLLPFSLSLLLAGPFAFGGDVLAGTVGATTTPTGGVVVGGSGSIAQDGANTVINQHTAKLALDWQTFNVGKDASVLFNQPSFSAVALNRILDQKASQIFGRITSNGQVFLINTHGIIFGASARMNVGGLMASTLDLTPTDFLASRYNLDAHGGSAGVVNHGLIQAASGGSVALVGGKVSNDGVILANYGRISLDGADRAVLDFDGTGLINIQVTGALQQRLDSGEAAVANKGTLQADGGTVVLQASAAKHLFTNLVNNSGVIDAGGISTDGGVVRLVASGGNTENSGSIDVSGVHGGSVQLLSDQNVSVTGSVDASGSQGGGSIRVGGGYQGGEGLQAAAVTYVGPDARLNADALQRGNGGSVVLWSNTATGFKGNISARGGAAGGNGGMAEVSSRGYLDFGGLADLRAPHGVWGTLLLDPNNITISDDANTNPADADPSGFAGGVFTPGDVTLDSTINTGTIVTQLDTGNVNIKTLDGDITVANGFTYAGDNDRTLTLDAALKLTFNDGVTIQSTGGTDGTHTLSGDLTGTTGVVFGAGSGFITNGGNLDVKGGPFTLDGALNAGAGTVTLNSTGAISQATAGVITAGALTGNSTSDITLGGAIEVGTAGDSTVPTVDVPGSIALTSTAGTITQDAGSKLKTHGGTVSIEGSALDLNGTVDASTTDNSASAGDVTLTATGGDLSLGGAVTGNTVTLSASNVAVPATLQSISGSGVITAATLTGNSTGDTTLDGNNQITTLGNFSAANFSLSNAGPLTVGGALVGTGVSLTADNIDITGTINAGAGVAAFQQSSGGRGIVLGGSKVAGSLSLTSAELDKITAGTISVGNAGSGNLGITSALNPAHATTLSLNSGGTITQTGGSTITVNTLAGSSLGATTLGEAGNAISALGTFSADGFTLDTGALAINGTLDAGTGQVKLTSTGAISEGAGGAVIAGSLTGSSVGATTLDQVGNKIAKLDDFSATDFTLKNAQALSIEGALTADSVNLTSTGVASGITQTAAGILTVTGDSRFDAGAGELSLDNAGNHFTGAVSLNNSGANNVTLNNGSNALVLDTSSVGSGALTVTALGITQNGALTQYTAAGTTTFNAGLGELTLDQANTFTGAVSLNNSGANNVTLNNGSNALELDTSSVGSGALTVTAVGITQSGALTQDATAGTTTFNAGLGELTLDQANTFTGAVSLNNSGANGVTLNNGGNALTLDTSSVGSGALTVTALGIAQNGALTQTASADAATFNAGAAALTLDQANNFTGAVSLNNSGANDVAVTNAGALVLGQSTVGGNLSVTAGGSITQSTAGSNPLVVAGTSTFAVTVPTANVILDDAGNSLTGLVTIGAGGVHNLSLTNTSTTAGSFVLPASIGGNLTLNYKNAALSLSGTTLLGALDLTAGNGITLGGNISADAGQAYHSKVLLNADTSLTTANSAVTFDSTVDNATTTPQALAVNAGTGIVKFIGAVGGDATNGALGALTVSGSGATSFGAAVNAASVATAGAATLGGDVTTTGGTQTYADAVTLNQSTTLTGSQVNLGGVTGNANALTVAGDAVLDGTLNGVSSLTVDGTTALNAGGVTTTGTQTYTGAVTLGADTTLTSSGSGAAGDITLASTVDGGHALVVNTAGTTSFGDVVGGIAALTSLTTDAPGSTSLAGDVITSAGQTYGDAVTLGKDTTLTASLVSLAGVTGGGYALGVTGDAVFGGALSSVASLIVSGTTAIDTASVTTTGAQTYGGDITLGANTTLTGGAIGVQGVVGGAHGLTVNASSFSAGGALDLGGDLAIKTTTGGISQTGGAFTVGGTSSFDAGANDITLNQAANAFTGAVSLTGNNVAITNAGALELGASTMAGTLGVTAGGNITQSSGGAPLSVTGTSTFTVTAAGSNVLLKDPNNDLQGAVTVGASGLGSVNDLWLTNTSTTAGSFVLPASIGGSLTLNYTDAALSLSDTTVAGALDVTAKDGITLAGNISANGGQAYHSAVLLGGDSQLTVANGAIVFDQTVDNVAAATPRNLTVVSGGNAVTFSGAVGSVNGALGDLSVTGSGATAFAGAVNAASLTTAGDTTLGGDVTTAGAQAYADTLTLNQTTTLTGTQVTLAGVTGNAHALTVAGNGVLGGTLTGISDLTVNGTTALNAGGITTTGTQTYTGAVTLGAGADTVLTTTNSAVTFGSTLDNATATTSALTVSAGSGDVTFTGAVGGGSNGPLGALIVNSTGTTTFDAAVKAASLVTDSGGGTTLGGDVTTSGVQTYGDGVTLDKDTTLTGSLVTLAGVAGAGYALGVTGNAALGGALSNVGSLIVSGTTAINTTGVSTTGAQTYDGDITLGANTTLTGGAISLQGVVGGTHGLTVNAESFSAGGALGLGGDLAITTTTGGINQIGGAFTVGGTSSFDAGANDISLNQPANAFSGAVSLNGNNVAITNAGALVLGTSTIGGTLGVSTGGSITQSGPLGVTGASTFTVTAAATVPPTANVMLDDAGNSFGDVTIAATNAGSVNNFSLTNINTTPGTLLLDTSIGNDLILTYTNAALSLPNPTIPTTVIGKLELTAGGGITLGDTASFSIQTGGDQIYHSAVLLGNDTTLTATGGAITFDTTVDNKDGTARALVVDAGTHNVRFGGAVGGGTNGALGALSIASTATTNFSAAVNAASLAITGAGGITTLGSNVTTTGAQSYGGAVRLSTDTTLSATGATGDVTFASFIDNADVTQRALTVAAGGTVSFAGAVGGGSGALKTLTVTSNGDISQAAPFNVVGVASFSAGAHSISLGNTGNRFGSAVSLYNTGAFNVALANADALVLGNSSVGSGSLTLTGAGISQLSGSAVTQAPGTGAVTLNANANDLVLAEAGNDFTGPVTATGKAVELKSANALTIASLTNAANSNVLLSAGGQLTLTSTINDIDTGSGDLTLESGRVSSGSLTLPGKLSGHNITLTSADNLSINNALTGTGAITLTSRTGDITQDAAGIITSVGGALAGTSGGSTTLNGADNKVATLGLFQTGGNFSFNNAQSLTVNHAILANGGLGNITLTTTGANSNLALETQIQGTDVTLGAGGAISQTAAGTIQAGTLTGTSTDATALTGPNEVGTLKAFTSGGDFSFTNAQDLTVVGPLAASGGNITLNTNSGAGGDLLLNTGITATNVELEAGGKITQLAGTVITAATLTGEASGDVALDGTNLITTLGDFSAANFSLVNGQGLSVGGALTTTGGTGSISLRTSVGTLSVGNDLSGGAITLDSAADLTLAKNVTGTDTVALKSGGAINQTAGIITAGTLSGGSATTTTLTLGNQVTALGDFAANGFSLTNNQSLAVNGALAGGSSVVLKTTAGDLTEGAGGVITAATLTGSSAGDTTLGGSNLVDTLGNFDAANFSLSNAKDLAVSGTLNTTGGTGNISLKTTSGTLSVNSNLSGGAISLISANDLALGQTIDGSVSVNLGAGGAITQSAGGVIHTALLTGTSGGSTTLDQGNIVSVLGTFTTGGNFTFNSAQSLTVSNPVSANNGLGNITLTTSGPSSDLELATQITGTTVTLGATGKITQTSAGTIQATTLTGHSGGDTTLTGSNQVGTLGQFSTGGNFSFTNARTLTVTGPLSAPGGTVSLSSAAGPGGDLLLNTSINANAVSLAAGGAITQQAGTAIQAGTLTGSASGKVSLDGANLIGTLGSFSAAGFSLTNAQGLTVNGPLATSGDVSLTTTSGVLDVNTDLSGAAIKLTSAGDLTLAHAVKGTSIALQSGGKISQAPTGSLSAATLTGSSVGSTVLGGSGSMIGALGDFSANGFSLTNGQTLAVNGVLNGGPSVVLKTTAGDLTINGTVKGTATTLTSAGAIGEGDTGVLSAATLTGSSVGATTLASTHNAVGALNGFTAQGFSLTNGQALTVSGVVDGGATTALTTTAGDLTIDGSVKGTTATLTSAGALSEGAGGTITAARLSGGSTGDTVLNGANLIGTLGSFNAANLDLISGQALTVAGPLTVDAGGRLHLTTTTGMLSIDTALSGGDVALTSAGDLTLTQAVKGTTLSLVSAGNISQTDSGIVTAGTLTGSSTGSTNLDPVNHVDTLGSFTANGFSLASDRSLTVTGPLDGGSSVVLITTNGGNLAINGAVSGKDTTLTSAGAISEGAAGSLLADTLTGSSTSATTLDNAANRVGTLNSFSADGFSLTTGQALTVAGALAGGSGVTLVTTSGDLVLNAAVSGGKTTLRSAGAINEGLGGSITATTLTGSALGPTMLGSATQYIDNYIGTLGGFSTPAGFSLTNSQTLHLASVDGSAYAVDAGHSALYLAVTGGDLLQTDKAWTYDGVGTWSSSGRIGAPGAPIYVIGDGVQTIAAVGQPPAYFYALDRQGNLLALSGGASVNVPTSALTSNAQNTNNHTDSYIDPGVLSATYRAFGIVPSGILLPEDQQRCAPDDEDCLNE